jgi:hypothetical protein
MASECNSNFVLVFYGRSGAGKSTLMSRLSSQFGCSFLDIYPFVQPNKLKFGNDRPNNIFHVSLYNDLLLAFKKDVYQAIEMPSTLEVKYFFPRLLEFVKIKQFKTILIHCVITLEQSKNRNALRVAPVPDWILIEQDNFEKAKIIEFICGDYNIPTVYLDCSMSLDLTYTQLIERLNTLVDL